MPVQQLCLQPLGGMLMPPQCVGEAQSKLLKKISWNPGYHMFGNSCEMVNRHNVCCQRQMGAHLFSTSGTSWQSITSAAGDRQQERGLTPVWLHHFLHLYLKYIFKSYKPHSLKSVFTIELTIQLVLWFLNRIKDQRKKITKWATAIIVTCLTVADLLFNLDGWCLSSSLKWNTDHGGDRTEQMALSTSALKVLCGPDSCEESHLEVIKNGESFCAQFSPLCLFCQSFQVK